MIITDAGHFTEHIQRAIVRVKCKIQSTAQRLPIQPKRQVSGYAAQPRMNGLQGFGETFKIRFISRITNVEVLGAVCRAMQCCRYTADDYEVNVEPNQ